MNQSHIERQSTAYAADRIQYYIGNQFVRTDLYTAIMESYKQGYVDGLQNYEYKQRKTLKSIDVVARLVAEEYGVDIGSIFGDSHKRTIADARHTLMYMLYWNFNLTTIDIAKKFKKSPASVWSGIKKILNLIKVDISFKGKCDRICANLPSI